MGDETTQPLALYDGECGFCHASVRFLLNHERRNDPAPLHFAALKSATGRAALVAHGLPATYAESMVLIEAGGRTSTESTSVLRAARHLRWPWRAIAWFLGVPRPIRDVGYRFVARHRGRFAGHVGHCEVPLPSRRERFIEVC